MTAQRRFARRVRAWQSLAGATLLALGLPGCPLSDKYFVDPNAGITGGMPAGGVGGASGTGGDANATGGMGAPVAGASAGGSISSGGMGGDVSAGTGGSGKAGGKAGKGDGKAGGKADGKAGREAAGGADGGSAGMPPDCEPSAEVCDGVSNDCDDEIDEDSACPAGCTARQYDGHTYVLCMSSETADAIEYDAASDACQALGGELGLAISLVLAPIETAEEDAFIENWIATTAPVEGVVWMGANDQFREGTWVWGRGPTSADTQFFSSDLSGGGTPEPDRYNDFGTGMPDGGISEDCGGFDGSMAWQWNDFVCRDAQMGYLCEQDP